jgi:hypothetical protein
VHFAAPGVDVITFSGISENNLLFQPMSGASMAAGIATGALALAVSSGDLEISPEKIRTALEKTSTPVKGNPAIKQIDAAALISSL